MAQFIKAVSDSATVLEMANAAYPDKPFGFYWGNVSREACLPS